MGLTNRSSSPSTKRPADLRENLAVMRSRPNEDSKCYAAAAIYGRSFNELPTIVPAAGSMIMGAALLIPPSLFIDRPWLLHPSRTSIEALIALAVFSTALAFVIYFKLMQTLGSVGTTSQAYLRVPIGVAIGIIFLGESLSPTAWVGLVCVVAGVAAMTIPRHRLPHQ
jgi:drug/metabolite transporter (DMT)-like permease